MKVRHILFLVLLNLFCEEPKQGQRKNFKKMKELNNTLNGISGLTPEEIKSKGFKERADNSEKRRRIKARALKVSNNGSEAINISRKSYNYD